MNIGIQYWAEGGSAPGSWTTVDVLISYPRPLEKIYHSTTALDGTNKSWPRRYLRATLQFKPNDMAATTPRVTIEKIIQATYWRIKDTRHVLLGDANTIDFVRVSDTEPTRSAASMASETVVLELISSAVAAQQV